MLQIRETRLPLPDKLIEVLKKTDQNPRYHAEGNVYNHTLLVLEQYEKNRQRFGLSPEESLILYWVSILHDIGKPNVTVWKNGRWSARGHEKAGVPIARDFLLQKPDITARQRRHILDLVRWHNAPLRWIVNERPVADYWRMATRTDLRLLLAFACCDILGRICERKSEILEDIELLYEEYLPAIEASIGTFDQLQLTYERAGLQKKNALWNSLRQEDPRLLEKLLQSEESVRQIPLTRIVMSIGAGGIAQTAYLKEHYPAHVYCDLDTFFDSTDDEQMIRNKMREVKRFLSVYLQGRRPIVLDGRNVHEAKRQEIADYIRQSGGELHYLFFDRSLGELLSESTSEGEAERIRQAYQALEIPHPWEAHKLEIV